MACNINELSESAKCFMCYSEKQLLGMIVYMACDDSGGGGGTEETAEVWSGSGEPTHTPTVAQQIYFDTDTGAQYNWYSGAWH